MANYLQEAGDGEGGARKGPWKRLVMVTKEWGRGERSKFKGRVFAGPEETWPHL